ncbi:MAG: conserved repeat domain protein, partial [Polaromonas sp.]|nr:conserved repeat domain protein [Polaromonas sp.]
MNLRRWVGLALALAILVVLTPVQAQGVQRYMLNPSFEEVTPPLSGGPCYAFTSSDSVPGWSSNDTGGGGGGDCTGQSSGVNAIEIWRNNFNGVQAFAGIQHAELNANSPSRLSQTICMKTGDTVTWAYSHRGRSSSTIADVAEFSVGGPSNIVNTARTTSTGATTSTCSNTGSITNASCSRSTVSNWGRHTGTFTWQGGNGNQDIGFAAVSTAGGNLTVGNFLDDVQFTVKPMVEFPSATLTFAESAGTVNFQLRVAGLVPAGGMAVPFTITGTATNGGVDYTLPSTFTVPAGEYALGSLVNVPVSLVNDSLPEGTETVIVTIDPSAAASPYSLGSTTSCGGTAIGSATLSITDDDVSVTLNKALVPTSNTGVFNLSITGGTPAPAGGTNPANNQGNGGSTGAVKVAPSSTITLAETAGTSPSTSLANYTTALSCVDASAATVTVTGSGTSRTITTPALSASAAARTITCTYVNQAQTTVTVSKTTQGGVGGPFTIAGAAPNANGFASQGLTTTVAGTPVSGAAQTLTTPGAVTDIQESAPVAGYTLSSITCTGLGAGGTATTNLTGATVGTIPARSVRLDAAATASGGSIACAFVNQRPTTVTVSKTTQGGVGGPFTIAGAAPNANGFASQGLTTTVAGTPVSGAAQTLTIPGAVTDIQESALVAGYTLSSITCTGLGSSGTATTNLTGATVGTIPARSVRLDAAATASGSSIACAFVNAMTTTTIQLSKALAGDRMAVGDQFSVAIRTGGVSGTVVSSATNATTTGTYATVTAGKGTTGSYSATAGTTYTLTEAAAGGADLTNYSAAISCTDAAGVQTGLPSGVAFNPAVGYAITPVAGAALSCTITNTPILVHPTTAPVISCSSDGNIFNTAYNGNPAGPAKTSGLDNIWERGATFGATQPSSWTLANVATTNPGWSAYDAFPASRFIAHQANTDHNILGSVDLWYRYVFTMNSNVVLSSFRLSMDFYADNSVEAIYVNGVLQTVAGVPDSNPYNALHYNTGNALSASLASNWQAGTNTILVRVSSGPPALGFMAKNTVSALCQPQVRLQKALGGLGRAAAADQFTVDIRTGGVSGTVVNSTTNSTTLGSGATVTAGSGNTGVYTGAAGTAYTLNETMAPGSASTLTNYTRALSCTNTGGSTSVSGFASLPLTFTPVSGDNVLCTVTNTPAGTAITGRVFLDNGISSGTANDGLINGGEAGLAGITVRLTNCAATVHASGVTDGTGAYSLAVLSGTATGAALCVEQTSQGTRISTGASVGGTALPSGTATPVASTTYTYTRTSTPDRIAFTWNGTGHSNLNFGDVDTGTFAPNGSKSGLSDTTVSYPHTFTAGTGGSVSFAISATTSAPTLTGWSEKIFADLGCTGTLQAGAAQLYPPAVAGTAVTFGQQVCVIMQQFIPATAQAGYGNDATVQANFTYSNANPALPTAGYTLHDITNAGNGTLELKKEVRNVTQGVLTFGINNQAKSGETLEYRISYTNNAGTPMSNLLVSDTTPVYTTFVSSSAGTTPTTLTACTKNTPSNPSPAS